MQRFLLLWLTLLSAIVLSLGVGGFWLYQNFSTSNLPQSIRTEQESTDQLSTSTSTIQADSAQTVATIAAQLAKIQDQLDLLKKSPSVASTYKPPVSSKPQEYLLYMGTGETDSLHWTDIDSATVTINPANYGNITEVRFEAALSIEGGEVHARFMNMDTDQVYYESEIKHNQQSTSWITSNVIRLPLQAGNYKVQLRSGSGEKARLDGSRIKIVAR